MMAKFRVASRENLGDSQEIDAERFEVHEGRLEFFKANDTVAVFSAVYWASVLRVEPNPAV